MRLAVCKGVFKKYGWQPLRKFYMHRYAIAVILGDGYF